MKSNLHNILRQLRKEQGKTQQELANILGVSQRVYSDYEAGKCSPSIETLIALADYFRVSIDFLVGRYVLREDNTEE